MNGLISEDRNTTYYACYRYSTKAGFISKNLFTVTPYSEDVRVCQFRHDFCDLAGAKRTSIGVIYSASGWIYFVGQQRDGSAKIMVIQKRGNQLPELAPALVMSKGSRALISRAAIKLIDKPLDEKDIGIRDETTDPEFKSLDFRNKIVPLIRNDIEFRPIAKIVFIGENGKEEEVKQTRLVEMVPLIIDGSLSKKGSFFFKTEDGKMTPFNPAAHEDYPFNQAIEIADIG